MSKETSLNLEKAYRFSIAPMLDCTDTHFRVLMRQITKRALLYTEMVVGQALYKTNNPERLLVFDPIEHPIALQLAGDNPEILSKATHLGAEWGYDEINLNVGCPSPKVKANNFGACLMADSEQVARCIEAMVNATNKPITIKHRIGIDNLDNYDFLKNFVDRIASAGAKRFSIHARKALLKGLNPKQNRTIPPLQYDRVALLKTERPSIVIELNGGLDTEEKCIKALKVFDGVMVGRAAYNDPLHWQNMDHILYGDNAQVIHPSQVINAMIPYTESHLNKNGKLWDIAKHLLHLVQKVPGARHWRHELTQQAQKSEAQINVLEEAARRLEDVGL